MVTIHGIIQYYHQGHKYVDVVVTEDHPDVYKQIRVGVDIKVNHGTILTFLGNLYGMEPGHVSWPHYIKAGDI